MWLNWNPTPCMVGRICITDNSNKCFETPTVESASPGSIIPLPSYISLLLVHPVVPLGD
ncbi:MAG: hypothetical protein RBS85_05120 [Methanofastidiosum sp.]|nr:hypothetical protein [Methanofastidiosum sp.]